MYQKAPRGEARREAILKATLSVIADHGTDGVTHRAVAAEAGVPLSATTYWFGSREELLEETLRFAAREETERLERLVLDLAPRELSVREWAKGVSEMLMRELASDRDRHMALYELGLEAARNPALRPEVQRMHEAQLNLAELGARAAGSDDPAADAPVIVAALFGLLFAQLALPHPRYERDVMLPALERLFERLVTGAGSLAASS